MVSMGTRELVFFFFFNFYETTPSALWLPPTTLSPSGHWSRTIQLGVWFVNSLYHCPLLQFLLSDTRVFIYSPKCLGLVYDPCGHLRVTCCQVAKAIAAGPALDLYRLPVKQDNLPKVIIGEQKWNLPSMSMLMFGLVPKVSRFSRHFMLGVSRFVFGELLLILFSCLHLSLCMHRDRLSNGDQGHIIILSPIAV